MNRIKRTCALLVAIALIFGVVIQSGIRGVFAVNSEQGGEQTTQVTQPVTEPVTEPITEPVTEPTTEAVAEPTTAPDGEAPTTEPPSETDGQPADSHPADVTTDVITEDSGDNSGDILPEINIYQQLMSCGSLAEMEVLLFAEENAAAVAMLTQEELSLISARIEEICAAIAQPTEADVALKERLLAKLNEHIITICPDCGGMGGVHSEDCPAYVPVCTCGSLDGIHAEDCPAYVPICTCGSLDGVHTEDCPAYVPICTCGSLNGVHAEDCPAYVAEDEVYIWSEFTDFELAMWLMDEANAETVKAILADETTEEYAELTLRIDAILDGEDPVLAEQLMAYLTALAEMDGAETLAEKDQYIYFDLAAGDVTIGKSGYSGAVYVGGTLTTVSGTHLDTNKYYIYQSTTANRNTTGYANNDDYINNKCTIPSYPRVEFDGQAWTDYITNNKDVYAVSRNWDTAAAPNIGRTSTKYKITFESVSDYTADVIIDNIWTTHQEYNNTWRTTGGIGANLNYYDDITNTAYIYKNVNIYLRIKGDNRVSCVHYSAGEDNENSINFFNGDSDAAPGSITVADFPEKWQGNHWNAVIGGADNKAGYADKSDGIVIESGYIYAGATFEDNCTAIGGGGNDYGGVTINGGTVTAVTGGTGTAIGGGIGYSDPGGNTDILITGGTIYAYNLGMIDGKGDGFAKFVPAAAIGGGGSNNSAGGLNANITINGGTIYAQSMGGPGIGGGGSADSNGGGATININGGTIIAKSVGGTYGSQIILPGVSIGGGTGNAQGGSVELTITEKTSKTILRTGSIGGGLATTTKNIGSANVTITDGDITGQVIMKGGTGTGNCTFNMSNGKIHGSNVVKGYTIPNMGIPNLGTVDIEFIEKNGGAVWMEDEKGVTTITGGTIEGCTAYNGGAIFMTGGTFKLSETGTISGNTATDAVPADQTDAPTEIGLGGAVYISGGNVEISGGTIQGGTAQKGGAVYMNGGEFNMSGGKLTGNQAVLAGAPADTPTDTPIDTPALPPLSGERTNALTGWGGAVCVEGGNVTITDGDFGDAPTKDPSAPDAGHDTHGTYISKNSAVYGGGIYVSGGNVNIHGGRVEKNTASSYGGGVYLTSKGSEEGKVSAVDLDRGHILNNTAIDGGGVYLPYGDFTVTCGYHNTPIDYDSDVHGGEIAGNKATRNGGGLYMKNDPQLLIGMIHHNTAGENGGGVCIEDGKLTLESMEMLIYGNQAKNGGGVAVLGGDFILGKKYEDELSSSGSEIDPMKVRIGMIGMTDSIPMPNSDTNPGSEGTDSGSEGATPVEDLMDSYYNIATGNGGGVYVSRGNVYIYHGYIWGNKAEQGGGVYLDKTVSEETGEPGKFVMDHPEAVIRLNEATDGAGIFLYTAPELKRGNIAQNEATGNGGGIYIYDCPVILNPTGMVNIANNTAKKDGGGIYIHGITTSTGGASSENADNDGAFDAVSGATGTTHPIGLKIADTAGGSIVFANNVATESGGAVCISVGHLYLESELIRVIGNEAKNGGGVAVLNGYFLMTKGSIGEPGDETQPVPGVEGHTRANKATNGGGVYVSAGTADIDGGHIEYNTATYGGGVYVTGDTSAAGGKTGQLNLKSGTVANNTATADGGGFYVKDGNFTMGKPIHNAPAGETPAVPPADPSVEDGGTASAEAVIANNTASADGGGGYVAGDFKMLSGRIGGVGGANTANKNGGGIYVADGNVTIVYGDIEYNTAKNDGGGFFVSAATKQVKVVMLSGKLNNNRAEHKGGGMAVESSVDSDARIEVDVGCLLEHQFDVNKEPIYPIQYVNDYGTYSADGTHLDCPEVINNSSGENGGGFYMKSPGSTLSFYCVEESGNTAADSSKNCWGLDVEDGTVVIGDDGYHNKDADDLHNKTNITKPRGNISMESTILVTGGLVDIYGDMDNPIFSKEITVDIQNKDTDHFMDHRHADAEHPHYKVHYFENFKDAGQYKEYTYSGENPVITIEGAIFSHPGYTIRGWYTQKVVVNENDPANSFYEVGKNFNLSDPNAVKQMGKHSIGCEICGEKTEDEYLLILYAIWDENAYYVNFNPNIPIGEAYTGIMQQQQLTYSQAEALYPNAFKRPGYDFKGWSLYADREVTKDPDGNEVDGFYADQEEVLNLTSKAGETITLYAHWTECKHDKPERWSYKADGSTLIRDCSCGGQTLTATLSAFDTVYNGIDQPATLVKNGDWGKDELTVGYECAWLADDALNPGDTDGPLLSATNQPVHAGEYTASITKTDTKGNVTKSFVKYTIDKALQSPPEAPSYTVTGNTLTINKLAHGDPNKFTDAAGHEHTSCVEYRVLYYIDDTPNETAEWQTMTGDSLSITLDAAYTSYYVEARYQELNDYKASDPTRAASAYFFAGDVEVYVICDEGITHKIPDKRSGTTTDVIGDGLPLLLTYDSSKYYLVSNKYDIDCTAEKKNPSGERYTITKMDQGNGEYKFTGISTDSIIRIKVGKARKITNVEEKVAPGQVFRALNSSEATISNDSAFTAAFKLTDFDPYREVKETNSDGEEVPVLYGAYSGLNLTFGSDIPKGTTIIMLDIKKDGKKEYWYYRAKTEVTASTAILLTDFTKMGGKATDKFPFPTLENSGYVDLNYQFIVDFSQCEKADLLTGNLSMKLEAVKQATLGDHAQNINPEVNVTMATPTFTLTKSNTEDSAMTYTFACTYDMNNDNAKASKWENRTSALVLVPTSDVALPPDARLKAEISGSAGETTYITQSVDKKFIVPMSLLKDSETVKLTLESSLLPVTGAEYKLNAQWWVSQSKAGKSPLDGTVVDYVANTVDVNFGYPAKTQLSLKPEGTQRVLTPRDTLKLDVKTENMVGYNITATLERKGKNDVYSSTGKSENKIINIESDKNYSLNMAMSGQQSGSYRIMFAVRQGEDKKGAVVLEVPYYFVISD